MSRQKFSPDAEALLRSYGVDGVRSLIASKPLPPPELPPHLETILVVGQGDDTIRTLTRADLLLWLDRHTRTNRILLLSAAIASILGIFVSVLAWWFPRQP